MSLLVLQHSPKDRPGLLATLPFELRVHRADLEPAIPELRDAKGLIVLGGPQAAYSDENFASRAGELRLLQEALAMEIPVLGVCLGAQLLAVAGGGRGFRMEQAEIGWLPVTLTADAADDPLFRDVDATFVPRQHHYDSFTMPDGAVRLGSSEQCVEQAFRIGRNAWGVQFHFEMLPPETKANAASGESESSVRVLETGSPAVDEAHAKALSALAPTAHLLMTNFAAEVRNASRTSV